MKLYVRLVAFCSVATLLGACATTRDTANSSPAYGAGGSAQMFQGMGAHTRRISTDSPEAQRYFGQGLNWLYAFNHDEAVRSFTRAAELDPRCAMAWWGISYAQGPNYNDPGMTEARSSAAWAALEQALARIDDESPAERALIEALASRYEQSPPEDRTRLEESFANAMADVWARFPGDPDIGTFYAESLMVQHPWKLYHSDGTPAREHTNTVVAVLERVLAEHPENPGANHLYIHAIEPSNHKERAIAAADRLGDQVPASGHLRHMPSHIYAQVGMWDRSIEQNRKAMDADRHYRELSPEQGIQNGYMMHNSHMLAFSAMMVGREREALAAARDMWANISDTQLRLHAAFVDPIMCSVYDVLKRFGRWDEILAEPAPPDFLLATTAVWRAHRAIAYAAKKDFDNARAEQAAFRAAMRAIPAQPQWASYGDAVTFLLVSEYFVEAEIALQQDQWERSAALLEQAAAIEDTIGYGEPPLWLQPVRHTLGAVYLKAQRYHDAERVYRTDLERWPRNGWALYGLSRALEEQGRADEAASVRREYEQVWAGADEPVSTSCMCIPTT